MDAVKALITGLDSLLPAAPLDVDQLEIESAPRFASAFSLDDAVLAAAGAASLAFDHRSVSGDRIRTHCLTEVTVDGDPLPKWAPLSGYYETANGRQMQLHCNFEHHAQGVVRELQCGPERADVQRAILSWDPLDLEQFLIGRGLIAAYLRTMSEWDAHPHALATSDLPLLTVERLGDAPPRRSTRTRVLDTSRVLAGPVAGQLFAANGADVLRIDSPENPSVPVCVVATGAGKRNAHLDLRQRHDADTMQNLLADCDVWIDAYRPGALAGHGFGPESLSAGQVLVQLSAFDWVGPWAGRRGFDSIVQSTTGIVTAGAAAAGVDTPTPLPVQALDYMTGFLAAYAGERMRKHQQVHGGTWLVRVSLLRTRNWLVSLGGPSKFEATKPESAPEHQAQMESPFGAVTVPLPVAGMLTGPPLRLGSNSPEWIR